MSATNGSLTATGSITLTKDVRETLTLVVASGSAYAGVSFVIEGSYEGTNYFAAAAVRADTLAAVSGTITPADNAEQAWLVPTPGYARLRARVTAIGSGQIDFALAAASYTSLPQFALQTAVQSITAAITDPGNAGAIPVANSGYVPLVSAGPETRTLAAPTFSGQELLIYMKTDGGDITLTCSTTVNETGNNTAVFGDTGDAIRLVGVEEGSNRRWRITTTDGVTLSTV